MISGMPFSATGRSRPLAAATAAAVAIAITACQPAGNGVVSGTVTDTSGAPRAECSMVPEVTSRPRPPLNEQGYLSGADGGYSITLPAATYTLTAYCADTSGTLEEASVENLVVEEGTEVTADFEVSLPP